MGFGDVTTFKVPEDDFLFLPRIERMRRIERIVSYGDRIDQKVCCFPLGLRPYSQMRMVIHVSELPCPTLPICLVCPLADGKHQNKIAALGSTKRASSGGYRRSL